MFVTADLKYLKKKLKLSKVKSEFQSAVKSVLQINLPLKTLVGTTSKEANWNIFFK